VSALVVMAVLASASAADAASAQEQPKEEPGAVEIQYLSAADNTMQPALFYSPRVPEKRPLLVSLHTWGSTYNSGVTDYRGDRLAIEKGWVFIHPNFRGASRRPEATGSELVIGDIVSAVDYCKQNANVDESRIYLMGVSGGGYTALLMAGRRPDIWAGVSAWVPIADLKAWYIESKAKGSHYADDVARSCGGDPTADPKAEAEAVKRSPVTYLAKAKDVPLDIHGGLTDTTVSFAQSLWAFSAVADEKDRISEDAIAEFVATKQVPPGLKKGEKDGTSGVVFSRTSGKARVTIGRGGHGAISIKAAVEWLGKQRKVEAKAAPAASPGKG
jgi:poly(3-hydroxybutyrate) depolymerase